MSVSWQPTIRPTYIGNPVPSGSGFGNHGTSSGDYGNWFGSRNPVTLALSRRVPTRKLGALSITESENQSHHPAVAGSNPHRNDLDQSGKVNSFLSKVDGEERVPRSPRIPDLTDLPGRLARTPRTHHVTPNAPRNSPDLYDRLHDEGTGIQKDVNSFDGLGGQYGSRGQPISRPDQPFLERGITLIDWKSESRKALADRRMMDFERSKTTFDAPKTLGPIQARDYVIPKFSLERSNTQPNLMDRSTTSSRLFANNPSRETPSWNTADQNRGVTISYMQRSNTMIDGIGGSNPTNLQNNNEFRQGWNFRRVPSFHGSFTAESTVQPQPEEGEEGDCQSPQPQPQTPVNNHMNRYLFTMAPDSNLVKSTSEDISEHGSMKPRIPMYWLYGSRGRPNAVSALPITYDSPNHMSHNQIRDNASIAEQQNGNTQNLADTNFIAGGTDMRDLYRSQYSSYEDQRKYSDLDYTGKMGQSNETVPNFGGQTVKSILKKAPSLSNQYPMDPASRMRNGPGGRLPHLNSPRRNIKRVTFAYGY